ncbi:hypothetical protein GW17_00020114 [Ensete ventricosum]|nr:hypothetical protein GW17_00020114 [Ensete ventricosum]
MRIVKEVGFGRQRSEPPRFLRLPTASKPSHLFLPSCLLCFLGFPSAMPDPVAADGDDVDDVLVSFLESEILSGDQVLFFFAMYRKTLVCFCFSGFVALIRGLSMAGPYFVCARLYCMRWGKDPSKGKFRACAWKKLYIKVDVKILSSLSGLITDYPL